MRVAEKHQGGRNRARRTVSALAGPALLAAVVIGFYWKLVLTDQYTWLESPDIAYQVLPWFQLQAGEWHRGRFPLWDPFHATGQSLIGQAQPGAAYPLNWILFSLPLNNGWIRQAYLHWYFVLTRLLAAVFCYWLCRDLKRSRPASIVAGSVFALGGYVGATNWPQMVNGAIWAPLVFLFLLRALRGRRPLGNAALAGMFLGVAWLSGHHQVPIFLTLAAVSIWFVAVFRQLGHRRRVVTGAVVFCLFAVLTGALQVLPALEYGRLAKRWVGTPEPLGWKDRIPYTVHEQYSLDPTSVIGLVIPGVHRNASPLVGVVALSLAVLAVGAALRNPAVRLLALTGAGGLLLALGGYSAVHGVLYALVPMVEKARSPGTAIFILHFVIAVLTAWGIDRLARSPDAGTPRRLSIVLAATGALLYALVAAWWLFSKHSTEDGFALVALVSMLAAALFWVRSRRRLGARVLAGGCLVLILLELGYAQSFEFANRLRPERNRYLNNLSQFTDIIRVSRDAWPARVDLDDQAIPFNCGDWHGIDSLGGYLASLPANFVAMGAHGERTRMLLGVAYDVRAKPAHPEQQLLYQGREGVNVYYNPGAFPRVWSVHEVVRVESERFIGPYLADPNFDLARKAFVVGEAPPALEKSSDNDVVRLVRREPNVVRIDADMRSRGMVVLSDAFFPGWRATLDGQPARIWSVYGGLRGVVASAGRHRIEMRYRPWSVLAGGLLTAVGMAGACLLALVGRRRAPMLAYGKGSAKN